MECPGWGSTKTDASKRTEFLEKLAGAEHLGIHLQTIPNPNEDSLLISLGGPCAMLRRYTPSEVLTNDEINKVYYLSIPTGTARGINKNGLVRLAQILKKPIKIYACLGEDEAERFFMLTGAEVPYGGGKTK